MSFKDYAKNKKDRQESKNNNFDYDLAPNKFIQPLNYKKWEIIGNILEFRETSYMKDHQKPWKEFFYRYSRNKGGIFGFVALFTLLLCAFIIPFFTKDPYSLDPQNPYKTFFTDSHIFGTDQLGRDLWSRLWHGLRYSITLAVVATLIQVTIGLIVGIMMGHFPKFDKVMTFIIKVISNVPSIIVLIVITIVLNPTFWVIVFALTFTSWTGIANQMRSQVLRAKNYEWVAASKILGTPTYKVLLNYLPVVIPLLVTEIVFHIPGVILSETSLAFIGLSIPNTPTLGNLITDGSKIFTTFPRYVLIPSFLLIIVTTSIQLMSSAIQDSLLRQR
ncbi:ABC transporter permease [Mycoplasma crocodyli]|uniref:Oligopeptide ABC transporter, permease protein OppC n=1 Tax=Mycoplasma crocodyli (strain ATCC 51981 / MP145) TaxID=512564 RepID=D5E5E0_MYCCM|nr:ABC transporter permease [Mycoplasma crocodyli]ADE19969.1 oligopeptide ABC transporter, permease protein OppC [Mycoplasma crocodyli MP145]